MMNKAVYNEIHELIKAALPELEAKELPSIEIPPQIEMGDFAFPCFQLAKELRKAPNHIAEVICEALTFENAQYIERAIVAGPYVNFFVKPAYYQHVSEQFGLPFAQRAEHEAHKVMLEYSSPNPAKTFHIGHVRNTVLGSALLNISKYMGDTVNAVNYLNDTGVHVAKVMWLYLSEYNGQGPAESKGEWLGQLYVQANQRLAENEDLKAEIENVHQQIEAKNPLHLELLEKFKQWSQEDFDQIYRELNAHFDTYLYDSQFIDTGKEVVAELVEKRVAHESDGAIIVDMEDEDLGVSVVLKSDGSALYITKDLSMAQYRFKHYDVDKLIYVVGAEQILHFKQLFKILERNGFEQAKDCVHLPYGLVNFGDGQKMSSRKGNIILYRDVYTQMLAEAQHQTQQRHEDWSQDAIGEVARVLALAGLKFTMLKYDTQKGIDFDIKAALDMGGDTGPYILYTIARMNSLLSKADEAEKGQAIAYTAFADTASRNLWSLLGQFDEVVARSYTQNKPSNLTNYAIDLSQAFNHFYHHESILKEDNQSIRLERIYLVEFTLSVLKEVMELLNIEVLEKM